MKRMLALVAVCGIGWLSLAVAFSPAASEQPTNRPASEKLIVHEWGTFTGFAGSDGVHIPFGTAPGNDLPAFVMTRREQAPRLDPKIDAFSLIDWGKGGGAVALQRMETPVVYFYTAEPRDVTVAVDFPQGLLTEFYPPVRKMSPAFGYAPGELGARRRDGSPTTQPIPKVAKLDGGSLDWGRVRIIPQVAGERPAHMPEVPKPPAGAAAALNLARHYEYARETDAATVQFSDRPGEQHEERFLFYRGLGDFTLPITLTSRDDDHFEMNAAAEQPIPFAILLRIADGRARFAIYTDITGRQSLTLPAETVSPDQVGDTLIRALMSQGLFEKEARAMVKTWSSNWLGDAGTRLLYAVPRPITDALLPLHISPQPDETVRVMIGRIDVLTPSQEAKIVSLLSTSIEPNTAMAPEDVACLRNLGRFLDPALERAAKLRLSADSKRETSTLRWRFWNAPKPEQPAAVSAPH